jgi:hypothetical protein
MTDDYPMSGPNEFTADERAVLLDLIRPSCDPATFGRLREESRRAIHGRYRDKKTAPRRKWDTSSSQGRLLSTMLAAVADFERGLIRERTGEGRKRRL